MNRSIRMMSGLARLSLASMMATMVGLSLVRAEPEPEPEFPAATNKELRSKAGAVAFSITAQKGDRVIGCTATAMILDGQCTLLTDRHCLFDQVDKVTLQTVPLEQTQAKGRDRQTRDLALWRKWMATEAEFGVKSLETRVLKRSQKYDLAELELPAGFRERLCTGERLVPQGSSRANRFLTLGSKSYNDVRHDSIASIGFVHDKVRIEYPNNDPWWSALTSSSTVTKYSMSLDPQDVLVMVTDLDIWPGMSGGFSVLDSLEVVGINARYVPLQSVGFVLPLSSVADFLRESPSRPRPRPKSARSELSYSLAAVEQRSSNAMSAAGSNGLGATSNTQADPGGNTHADPGRSKPVTPTTAHIRISTPMFGERKGALALMQEPDEGIPMPDQPGWILLGVGDEQIDGYDDYIRKFVPVSGDKTDRRVMRKDGDYPALEIRKGLFERLQGVYRATPSEHFRRAVYRPSPQAPLGWERSLFGWLNAEVTVNTAKQWIILEFWEHQLTSSGSDQQTPPSPEKLIRFKYEMSQDAKTITIKQISSAKGKLKDLICDNRHFLKLVCHDAGGTDVVLSLSVSGAKDKVLSLRFGRSLSRGKNPHLDYFFGKMEFDDFDTKRMIEEMGQK